MHFYFFLLKSQDLNSGNARVVRCMPLKKLQHAIPPGKGLHTEVIMTSQMRRKKVMASSLFNCYILSLIIKLKGQQAFLGIL